MHESTHRPTPGKRGSRALPFAIFAIVTAGSLPACREDGTSARAATATATPSPTPAVGQGAVEPAGTPGLTPPDGSTGGASPDPTPPSTPGDGSTTDGNGAPMTSALEVVSVYHAIVGEDGGSSSLYLQRANGELWVFDFTEAPAVTVGESVWFRSESLVFGDPGGVVVSMTGGGAIFPVEETGRLR